MALVSTADKKRVCSQRDATADGFNALTKGHLCLFFFTKPIYCLRQRKAEPALFSRLLVLAMYLTFASQDRYIFPLQPSRAHNLTHFQYFHTPRLTENPPTTPQGCKLSSRLQHCPGCDIDRGAKRVPGTSGTRTNKLLRTASASFVTAIGRAAPLTLRAGDSISGRQCS